MVERWRTTYIRALKHRLNHLTASVLDCALCIRVDNLKEKREACQGCPASRSTGDGFCYKYTKYDLWSDNRSRDLLLEKLKELGAEGF